MQAILLAGGLGTRLRSVVQDRPKPMALVEGKPFMGYLVRQLARQGITQIIFAVGYKGSMVEGYFGDGSRFLAPDGRALSISYAYEEELLGTAGAIKNAGGLVDGESFLVLNADTFYSLDYGRLTRLMEGHDLEMALVLRQVPDVSRYGQAVLKGGMLASFNEKAPERRPGTINGGVYLMKKELLEEIPPGKVSLENEMIPLWLRQGRRLGGLVNDGYFIDIGVPKDYFRFGEDVKRGIVLW